MKLLAITTLSLAAITLSACDSHMINKAPGKYENEQTSTDANGTTTTDKTVSDVSVDSNGNKKEVVTKKSTKDPKGLFNKSTSTSTSKKVEGNY